MPGSRPGAQKIHFCFEFAGTFAHPAAKRIERAAARAGVAEAAALGIFGAASFGVGRELFWGSDRLHQALAWAT